MLQTDHYVGRMLEALREIGVEENTLVIFTADNGSEDPVMKVVTDFTRSVATYPNVPVGAPDDFEPSAGAAQR